MSEESINERTKLIGEILSTKFEEIENRAINSFGYAKLKYASEELKNDREFVLGVINSDGGNLLKYASKELKNDRGIVIAAIKPPLRPLGFSY